MLSTSIPVHANLRDNLKSKAQFSLGLTSWRFKNKRNHWISWGLFDLASSSWNNVKCQLDATRLFCWCILSSTCFGYIRPSSGALHVELQHMVFCTEFLDRWWSWEPLRRSCVRCGCYRATAPSAPYTRPTQRLSRPPPIQKLGAENHMLQLNM